MPASRSMEAQSIGPAHRLVPWRAPVCWWLGVAAFNVATAASRGVFTGHDAALHWWLSLDVEVPERTARWFLDGANGLLVPGWHASDRGPLQALLLLWGGRWSTNPVPAYIAGVVINSSWVVGLWWFLRTVGVSEARIRWTTLLTALTGSIWLNSVYPWPKLLAGALTFGCAAAILRRRAALAGLLGGLALLAHGAAVFALVGLIPWAVSRLGRRGVIALAVLVFAYAPWFAFGKLVDPPGDRLLKWHLAGTSIDTPDPRSPFDAITQEYADAGLDVVANKMHNVRVVLGDPTINNVAGTGNWSGSFIGSIRAAQVTRVAFAPGILLLGLIVGRRRVPRTMWSMLAAWLAAFVLLVWGGNGASSAWLHVAPMALVVGWVAACALASPRWMLPLQGVTFVGLWLLAPTVA